MYSIIIPCYKSSETIQRVVECTIEEMKNLGKTELEFVLVNDCSVSYTHLTLPTTERV